MFPHTAFSFQILFLYLPNLVVIFDKRELEFKQPSQQDQNRPRGFFWSFKTAKNLSMEKSSGKCHNNMHIFAD